MKVVGEKIKLQLLAFMLVVAFALSFASPLSVWADDGDDAVDVDLTDEEVYCYGGGGSNGISPRTVSTAEIPQKAYSVAEYVLNNNGAAPQGYKGGRVYHNIPMEEGAQKLPEEISYKEYDVNPYVAGQNRGTERLVVGGNNSVWYTSNHYYSFVQLQ